MNINLFDMERKSESIIEVPFLLSINFAPTIASMNVKGRAKVIGDGNFKKMIEDQSQKRTPPFSWYKRYQILQ
jgi:hypothetical protein